MKNLTNKFVQLEGLYQGGVIFIAFVIVPCLVGVFIDIIK
jgi:hypothetical protein